jgi:hypothetical protein
MHVQSHGRISRSERHAAARSEVSAVLDALLRGEPSKTIATQLLGPLHVRESKSDLRSDRGG